MSATQPPFVPSFYAIDQLQANNQHSITTARTVSSTHQESVDLPPKAVLSISPIRHNKKHPKPASAYPTQQLAAIAPVTCKEEVSTPEDDKMSKMPPLPDPLPTTGSSAPIKNLSNQFIGEETPAPHYLQHLTAFHEPNAGAPTKQETDDMEDQCTSDQKNSAYPFFASIKQETDKPSFGIDGKAMKHELEIDAALDSTYCHSVPKIDPQCNPADPNAIDTLDSFTIHSGGLYSNGSFDLDETYPPPVIMAAPDPKGVYARKVLGSRRRADAKAADTTKPKRKKSSKGTPSSGSVVTKPTSLDILRGRGGLTNRHPGKGAALCVLLI